MATRKQREQLKNMLPNKFQIRKELGEEQVYMYYTNKYDYGYLRLGELNQVLRGEF